MAFRFMRYAGSKMHLSKRVNQLIDSCEELDTYVEPFFGSGAIFYNLDRDFGHYILNDSDPNIMSVHEYVRDNPYAEFCKLRSHAFYTFGDIENDKDAYYAFRKYYNDGFHFTNRSEKGGLLYMLINSCINSLARFGKMGFNQGFGRRFYAMGPTDWERCRRRLKRATLLNCDGIEVLRAHQSDAHAFAFIDPPYFASGDVGYDAITESQLRDLIDILLRFGGVFAYTDSANHLNQGVNGWTYEDVRTMRNSCPSSEKEETHNEVLMTNVKESSFFDA